MQHRDFPVDCPRTNPRHRRLHDCSIPPRRRTRCVLLQVHAAFNSLQLYLLRSQGDPAALPKFGKVPGATADGGTAMGGAAGGGTAVRPDIGDLDRPVQGLDLRVQASDESPPSLPEAEWEAIELSISSCWNWEVSARPAAARLAEVLWAGADRLLATKLAARLDAAAARQQPLSTNRTCEEDGSSCSRMEV